jgi:SARP family transcriptional regulator, regulator of embCAB operon
MLPARVAPPLPDNELPQQLSIRPPIRNRVFEIVTPPGGLLVRRLAADLVGLAHEVAWVRPSPFEPDQSSLAALLLMALAGARRPMSVGKEPIVVVESPTSAQVELLLGELLTPHAPEAFASGVVLITGVQPRTSIALADTIRLEPPYWSARLARGFVPEQARRTVPLRQLCLASNGLAGLIEGALRTIPQIGGADFARLVAKSRQPAALMGALTSHLLSSASADRLAALEMAGHLGYAHARFRSLEPALARPAEDPWWVPLTDGWLQVDLPWRASLIAGAAQPASVKRSACLSRLVAELAEEGAIHEAIEISINAGWHGLGADLLTGEAERLLSSGRYMALVRWLDRLPAEEIRGHPALAALARELQPPPQPEDWTEPEQRSSPTAVPCPPRRHWTFRRSSSSPADTVKPLLLIESADPSAAMVHDAGVLSKERGRTSAWLSLTARTSSVTHDLLLPEEDGASVHATRGPGHTTRVPTTPAITTGETLSAGPRTGNQGVASRVRVDARLLGSFELHIDGQAVQQWRGNRGRMLLAYFLLHRSRPLGRDALGSVFWPDAAPEIVRNRLHVALYGLRRDLRNVSQHPIVVHGQAGFSLHHNVDLWLDTEAFGEAVCIAHRAEVGRTEIALTHCETALELYRGDLLEDSPFEEWALLDREQLRLKHLETLDLTATMTFELGHYSECIQLCQRLASGDLCREDIHRQLMRCYARLNQPHLAVRQYHQCERQLRDELGLEPAEPTRQLYDRIRRRQLV